MNSILKSILAATAVVFGLALYGLGITYFAIWLATMLSGPVVIVLLLTLLLAGTATLIYHMFYK